MSTDYHITIEKYAERYYIKKFKKQYKSKWDITLTAILLELKRLDLLLSGNSLETINHQDNIKICKLYFRIAGTNQSKRNSGNRAIVAVHTESREAKILLLYHKNHLGKGNETALWKKIVKANYPNYTEIL